MPNEDFIEGNIDRDTFHIIFVVHFTLVHDGTNREMYDMRGEMGK